MLLGPIAANTRTTRAKSHEPNDIADIPLQNRTLHNIPLHNLPLLNLISPLFPNTIPHDQTFHRSTIREQLNIVQQLRDIHSKLISSKLSKDRKSSKTHVGVTNTSNKRQKHVDSNMNKKSYQHSSFNSNVIRGGSSKFYRHQNVDKILNEVEDRSKSSYFSYKQPHHDDTDVHHIHHVASLPSGLVRSQTKNTTEIQAKMKLPIAKYIGRSNSNFIPGVIISNRSGNNFLYVPQHTLISGTMFCRGHRK